MAPLSTNLVWISAAAVFVLLILASIIFINTYKHKYDRDAFVTTVCVMTLSSLLATICLLPVDIALVSSTTSNRTGLKKDWATDDAVNSILMQLKVVYYLLFTLDALLCLVVVPFAYFFYEEDDEETTLGGRIRGALKYCVAIIVMVLTLFLVGFFLPVAKDLNGHVDLDYFKKLLMENHGERALTFITGILICLGTCLYILYTAPGFALLPVALIKTVPATSTVEAATYTRQELREIQEEIRIIESRVSGAAGYRLPDKDRRAIDTLQRRERTLLRKLRLEEDAQKSTWVTKVKAAMRPFTILFGLTMLFVALAIWVSMLLTGIDKAKNSYCGGRCGYILPHIVIFNPVNWVFVASSRFFPLDYVLTILLVLDLFASTVVGVTFVGIRFLWITFFKVKMGRTRPQGLLITTVTLTLTVLAINYALPIIIAPQYGHYGGQVYCNRSTNGSAPLSCIDHPEYLLSCTESANTSICTPTVVSTFINRITLNFPAFGIFTFWAQFVFLAVFLLTAVTSLVRAPKAIGDDIDEDELDEEEEESLLAGSRRRLGAAYTDFSTPGTVVDSRAAGTYGINDV